MKYIAGKMLEIVVFVCGGVVMVFELVGSRVVAPYAGTSIYVWTSLIGVILASLSLGYYYGGALADKRPNKRPLAVAILGAAIIITFVALLKDAVSLIVIGLMLPIEIKSLVISIILFAPASFLLGMVSPYAVRLRLDDVSKAGRTAGNLYAVSTAGSIAGTFLAGYYIIPRFGSTISLLFLALALAIIAALLFGRRPGKMPTAATLMFLGLFISVYIFPSITSGFLLADVDTKYNRIWVSTGFETKTGRPVRMLSTDPFGTQAAVYSDGSDDLVFGYTRFYRMSDFFVPNPKATLMIGGCAYTYPRYFLNHNPGASMDVVEIDPGMTEVARKYLGLTNREGLNIIHEDARVFLNANKKQYDVIFGDAFNSATSIPFQLTTKEAVEREFASLRDGGAILVNIISAIDGEKGKFARAEYATYKSVFPQVFLFPIEDARDATRLQNIMLVALKSEKSPDWNSGNEKFGEYLDKLYKGEILNDLPILTDELAPVEEYKRQSI